MAERRVRPKRPPRNRRFSGGLPLQRRLKALGTRHLQVMVGSLGRLTRHPVSNLMTMAVLGIALSLPALLQIVVTNGSTLGARWESVADIGVYLKTGVDEAAATALASAMRERDDIAGVRVVSSDDALDEFRAHSGFGDAIDALTENPLPVTLVVRPAQGYDSADDVRKLSEELEQLEEADVVQIDTEWVQRFQALLEIVRYGALVAAVLLASAVVFIIGNTIRLDIQNRREEIEVTKLIGGSDAFIRRPFLYSGFWYGLGGGLIALTIVALLVWLLNEPVTRVAGLYGSDFRLSGLGGLPGLALIGGGALLGLVGSWLAAARHMRKIEPGGSIAR